MPRIPHVFLTLRKGADSAILVLIEAKAEPKLQWLPVPESSPSTSLVVRGLLAKQAVPRMLADDSGRMTSQPDIIGLGEIAYNRCRLPRINVEFRMRYAQHPPVEPIHDVFQSFDAMPRLARARELTRALHAVLQ